MSNRTQITPALRYQVMRRDGFACQYCGGTPPEAVLQIDHVLPVALGGTNDATNLATSCRDCNAGKGKSAPDEPVVDAVSDRNKQWADALNQAASEIRQDRDQWQELIARWTDDWNAWRDAMDRTVPLPASYESSLITWAKRGMSYEDLAHLIAVAMEKPGLTNRDTFRYFAGCCWRHIERLEQAAERIMTEDQTRHEVD